jgi:hypothetical protein
MSEAYPLDGPHIAANTGEDPEPDAREEDCSG